MSTLATPTFLGIPRELRDKIYEFYLAVEGGFVFDHECNKLQPADKRQHGLALMYVCKQVAAETEGMALRTDTVTFSTFCSEGSSRRACRFQILTKEMYKIAKGLLLHVGKSITPEVVRQTSHCYPLFEEALRYIADVERPSDSMKGITLILMNSHTTETA